MQRDPVDGLFYTEDLRATGQQDISGQCGYIQSHPVMFFF